MKRLFGFSVFVLMTIGVFAQSPGKMSYQYVIRNTSGALITNHAVGMKISILQGSATGTVVFVETHTTTTNGNGLATIEIGGGTPVTGTITGINWSAGTFFLKAETDPAGGTNFSISGTSQLLSVPYALYANKSGETDPTWNGVTNETSDIARTGRVSIGTNTPGGILTVLGNSTTGFPQLLLSESEGDYARLSFRNTAAATKIWSIEGRPDPTDANSRLNVWYWNGSAGKNLLSITGLGRVGIGTADPGAILQVHSVATYVNGITPVIKISDNYKTWNIGLGSSGERFSIASEDLSERLTIMNSNGNVGIGTTSPMHKLDITGVMNLNKGLTGAALRCNGAEAIWYDGTYFSWGFGGTWNYFKNAVGIDCQPGTGHLLAVNGVASKPGGGTWAAFSDIRLKDVHGQYTRSLKEIIQLQPVRFNYKDGNELNLPSEPEYVGFIAQDVRNIFPETVNETPGGYLEFDMHAVNVAMVNAVKELNQRIESQQREIDELKNLLKRYIADKTVLGDE